MVKNTTRVQHYVWRHYLAPWTKELKSDGRIYVAMKRSDNWKLLGESSKGLVPLMSIAFEDFFYDLSKATDIDFEAAKILTDIQLQKLFPNKEFNIDYSQVYDNRSQKDFLEKQYISKIEENSIKFLDRLCNGDLPYKELKHYTLREKLYDDILKILMFGEDISTNREDETKEAIDELNNNPDEKFEFYEFIALQMLRTKFTKNITKGLIANDEKLKTAKFSEEIYTLTIPINVHYLATRFSQSKLQPILLINNTDAPFITADNPVINLCADYLSDSEPSQLALYSSFSPRIALLCTSNVSQAGTLKIDDSNLVRDLNHKVICACDCQIFSNDKVYLEDMIIASNK